MKTVKRVLEGIVILFLLYTLYYGYKYYKINESIECGVTSAKSGSYEEALDYFNEVLERDDDNKLAKKSIQEIKDYLLADDLYLKGKIEEAEEVIKNIIKNGVEWDVLKEDINKLEDKIENFLDEEIKKSKEKNTTAEMALALIKENDGKFLKKILGEKYYEEKPKIWCDLQDKGEEGKGLYNGINIFNLPIKNEAYIFYVDGDYNMAVYIVDKVSKATYRLPSQGGGVAYLMEKDRRVKEFPAVK